MTKHYSAISQYWANVFDISQLLAKLYRPSQPFLDLSLAILNFHMKGRTCKVRSVRSRRSSVSTKQSRISTLRAVKRVSPELYVFLRRLLQKNSVSISRSKLKLKRDWLSRQLVVMTIRYVTKQRLSQSACFVNLWKQKSDWKITWLETYQKGY